MADLQLVWPVALANAGKGWASVTGPCAAAAACLRRLGWRCDDVLELRDDEGVRWGTLEHSAVAFRAAVAASVRRWRFRRILEALPAASPPPLMDGRGRTCVVDLTVAMRPLVTKRYRPPRKVAAVASPARAQM